MSGVPFLSSVRTSLLIILPTLSDDRVLVLSKGSIVEYDTPRNLLTKADDDSSAHFKSLCKEAGPIVYRKLCQAAGLEIDVQ